MGSACHIPAGTAGRSRRPAAERPSAAREEVFRMEQHAPAENVTVDASMIGLNGSPTKVKKTFTPEVNNTTILIEGSTNDEKVSSLVEHLKADKVL